MARNIKETFVKVGYTLAQKMVDIDSKASQSKRKLVLDVVGKYKDKEQLEGILQGFEQYHKDQGASDATVRVRKSEVLTIFKAALRNEDNIQSLQDFKGGYHEWLTYARTLKGKRNSDVPSLRKPRIIRLTEKQTDKIKGQLQSANDTQLVRIAEDASRAIIELHENPIDAVRPILLVIQAQADILSKTKKFGKEYQNIGQQILEVVTPALMKLEGIPSEVDKIAA